MNQNVVLLVEDNSSDEALTRRALKKQGVEDALVVVRDGAEALEYLFATGAYVDRDPADVPRLILLDLKLPKLPGLEVLRQLRAAEHLRSIPIVVFTSSGEEEDIAMSYGLGCNSYLRKPIAAADLTESLRQVASYWLSLNLTPQQAPRAGALRKQPGFEGNYDGVEA